MLAGRHLVSPLCSVSACLRLTTQQAGLSRGIRRSLPYYDSSFPSDAPQSESRRTVERSVEDFKEVLAHHNFNIHAVGPYRRGSEGLIRKAPILIVGNEDDTTPSNPHNLYDDKRDKVRSLLVRKGLLSPENALTRDSQIEVSLHYVPKVCQGAALLYLTGDESYIRFLKLMAMEGMGLTFNQLGLWKPVGTSGVKSHIVPSSCNPKTNDNLVPPGITIQSADSREESTGERRMRETRRAMGLPEGLDLSLDLGPDLNSRQDDDDDDIILQQLQASVSQSIEAADSDKDTQYERIVVGSGSEADILDVLGLVWIPPSMRTVKEP